MSEFSRGEPAPERAQADDRDTIDEASADSFPASDAPTAGGTAADDRVRPSGRQQTPRVSPAQLQKFLGAVDFPADKESLLETARRKGADENAIGVLQDLPQDRFHSANDVNEALGKLS